MLNQYIGALLAVFSIPGRDGRLQKRINEDVLLGSLARG